LARFSSDREEEKKKRTKLILRAAKQRPYSDLQGGKKKGRHFSHLLPREKGKKNSAEKPRKKKDPLPIVLYGLGEKKERKSVNEG